eukprot:745974-Prymnesium_polylepis.1
MSRFVRTGLGQGVGRDGYRWGGAGYLLMNGDSGLASEMYWADDSASVRQSALRGFFAVDPSSVQGTSIRDEYLARRRQLPAMSSPSGWCSLETDDDGNYPSTQDHDDNASTPLRCAGDDPQREMSYDAFGYDAAFAVAHALHDLLEVQNRTEIVGSELLDTTALIFTPD